MLALNSAASLARRGARALSTAALPSTPPISLFGISGRYASAMYTAAAKKGELLAVEADLQQLEAAMAASPSVATFLKDPSQGRNAKASSVIEILTAAKACQTSKNSLATVAEGGRMGDVSKIIDDYMSLMTAAKGDVTATVTSAHPLTDEETKAIRAKLTEFLVSDVLFALVGKGFWDWVKRRRWSARGWTGGCEHIYVDRIDEGQASTQGAGLGIQT